MIDFFKQFQANVSLYADKTAVAFSGDGRRITWREMDEISSKVHAWLRRQGAGREDNVLIRLPRGAMIPVVMTGIWKNGSAGIICESSMAPERVRYILSDSSAKVVITEEELEEILAEDPAEGFEPVDLHDSAFVVYTSGTTGNPKGVVHEYGNMDRIIRASNYQGSPLCRSKDVLAYNAPLNFVAAMDYSINIFYHGGTMVIMDTDDVKNVDRLTRLYEQYGITCTFMTPSLMRTIPRFNSQMEWIVLGGEPCVNLIHDGITLYNGYNMSEAGRVMLLYAITQPLDTTPVGRNQAGEQIVLMGENGRPAAAGEPGEIAFVNDYVRGYINLPEKTAAAWHDGLYFTGDIGVKLPDGNIILQGRNDDMIKINGNRIEPAEIEKVSKKVLGLSWAAAKGFITPERSFVVLYYTDPVNLEPRKAREELAASLTSYMLPSYFVKLDEIPLLPNGKLDKRSLPVPDLNCYRTPYQAPETALEETLLAAFEQVLEMEHLGVNDDFYDLGGDSLRAIRLVTQVNDPSLNVPLLYQNRTVRRLALAMQEDTINQGKSIEHRDGNAREHAQPLAPIQYHLLDNQLYKPMSTFNNMPIFWRMPKKKVDLEKLLDAFRTLVRNQPALQSRIEMDENLMYVLRFDPSYMPELRIEQVKEEKVAEISKGLVRPFQLVNAPLYRFRILETERYIYVFMDFHHIFSDGTSIQIVCRNLSDAYHGKLLPRDHAYLFLRDVQKHQLNGDYERAHAWNLEKYGGKVWCRNITPDLDSTDNHAASLTCAFPLTRAELDDYCRANQMTINSLALAASLLTIHQKEQKNDILVSWLFHGRDQTAYRDCVAPLIKELPVAVSFDRIRSEDDLLTEVKEQTAQGINNADDPFIIKTTSIGINDTFRIRNQGQMRNFKGIEGIHSEKIELPDKDAAATLMNIQLLEDPSGEYSLCLTYGDRRYHKETAQDVLVSLCENIRSLGSHKSSACGSTESVEKQ